MKINRITVQSNYFNFVQKPQHMSVPSDLKLLVRQSAQVEGTALRNNA